MYGVNDRPSLWAVPALGEDKTGGVGASGAQGSHRSHQRRLGHFVWPRGGGESWRGSWKDWDEDHGEYKGDEDAAGR